MTQKKKEVDPTAAAGLESMAQVIAKRARKYMFTKYSLDLVEKKQAEERRRCRRLCIPTVITEEKINRREGARIIDVSMNEARLEAPFLLSFLSHVTLEFDLPGSKKAFSVVGWVAWSKEACQKGWYEVRIQFNQNHWEINQLLPL